MPRPRDDLESLQAAENYLMSIGVPRERKQPASPRPPSPPRRWHHTLRGLLIGVAMVIGAPLTFLVACVVMDFVMPWMELLDGLYGLVVLCLLVGGVCRCLFLVVCSWAVRVRP